MDLADEDHRGLQKVYFVRVSRDHVIVKLTDPQCLSV